MGYKVAVVGATGNVGREMLDILAERKFPADEVVAIASRRSMGVEVSFGDKTLKVKALENYDFSDIDICLMSAGGAVSKEWSPKIAAKGAVVIDNSSAWRMDPDVPLVVPEVNADAVKSIPKGIVANPNCSTIQMVVALKPLHDLARIKRVVVATYQASSGKGAKGVFELDAQVVALGRGERVPPVTVHAARLAGNVLPHDWKLGEEGYSEEEIKMIKETRKIMGDDTMRISPTTARVPVRVGHSEAINLEFERPITVNQAREALRAAPGIVLLDDYAKGEVPLALLCEGRDETFVGRIRKDPTVPNGLNLWVVADNLQQDAPTNAAPIPQRL